MSQVPTTIRIDSELKREFDSLCNAFGMSINTAFNIFVKAVVRSRSIPFKIEADFPDALSKGKFAFDSLRLEAQKNGLSIADEEINQEIASYRKGK